MGKSAISEGSERRILDIANGRVVAHHPVHLGLVQLWLAFREVQHEYHGAVTLTDFAADCGTTTKRAVNALCGYIHEDSYSYGELVKWAWELNERWVSRGIPKALWVVGRPDLTFAVIARGTNVAS